MIACTHPGVRSAHCSVHHLNQPINQTFRRSINPNINQAVRFYQPIYSSHSANRPVNLAHRQGSVTSDRSPLTAIRQSKKQKKLEKERARVQSIKKLSFNQYNLELGNRVKQYTDWKSLLLFLEQEMDNTKYNKLSSQVWTNPNKKHEQWTGQTIADIIRQLIKTRKTRAEVMNDDDSMLVLNRLCVIIESAVPKLHDELDIWKHLFHPYLYLRESVDKWNVQRIARRKAEILAAREAKLRAMEFKSTGDVVSDVELKRRMMDLAEKNRKLRESMPKTDDVDEQPEQHHLSWLFQKDPEEIEAEKQKTEELARRLRGEPESVQSIIRRMSQKGSKRHEEEDEDDEIDSDDPRVWKSRAESATRRQPIEPEIEVDEEPKKKVKKFFNLNAPKEEKPTKKRYFG